jgi:PhnB protein
MQATKVMANLRVADIETAKHFYSDYLGLSTEQFNLGWVARYASTDSAAAVQLVTRDATAAEDSVISVGTDDIESAYAEAKERGYEIVHPLTTEAWGIRRFFVRAPDGNLINITNHRDQGSVPAFHSLTPRMVVSDAAAAVEFLRTVFDAVGQVRVGGPTEVRIGDSVVMVTSAVERELFPAFLYVYVDDADLVYRRALAAGALSLEEPFNTSYGDRRAMVRDPFGNVFQIAHRTGDRA